MHIPISVTHSHRGIQYPWARVPRGINHINYPFIPYDRSYFTVGSITLTRNLSPNAKAAEHSEISTICGNYFHSFAANVRKDHDRDLVGTDLERVYV